MMKDAGAVWQSLSSPFLKFSSSPGECSNDGHWYRSDPSNAKRENQTVPTPRQEVPAPVHAAGSNRKVLISLDQNIRCLVSRPNGRSVHVERNRVKTSKFQAD